MASISYVHSELRVHIGPLGAADQVVDSGARVVEVQRNWRKLIGLEMETYALYRAAHEAPDPRPVHASFKSVCDFAAEKSDAWQGYTAHCAAHYAKRFSGAPLQSAHGGCGATGSAGGQARDRGNVPKTSYVLEPDPDVRPRCAVESAGPGMTIS